MWEKGKFANVQVGPGDLLVLNWSPGDNDHFLWGKCLLLVDSIALYYRAEVTHQSLPFWGLTPNFQETELETLIEVALPTPGELGVKPVVLVESKDLPGYNATNRVNSRKVAICSKWTKLCTVEITSNSGSSPGLTLETSSCKNGVTVLKSVQAHWNPVKSNPIEACICSTDYLKTGPSCNWGRIQDRKQPIWMWSNFVSDKDSSQ